MLAMYGPEKPFPVYCKDCWWSDKWDPTAYELAYDWEKPFFVQFRSLLEKVPRPNLITQNAPNSDYSNYVVDVKNCYLCFGTIESEDCMYGAPYESKHCVDTYLARECEYCYECLDCEKLSSSLFAQDSSASLNLLHCFDCKNCHDCIGCVGLRNKKYHIYNKEYQKEEFEKMQNEIFSRGREGFEEVRVEFEKLKLAIPHRFATTLKCERVSGDHIVQSKNAEHSFDIKKLEDATHCIRMIDGRDVHDTNYCEFMELTYDYLGFLRDSNIRFSNTCGECEDVQYSDFCQGSSHLFGCIGLRKKEHCIFNKEYEKQEYEEMVLKIEEQMNSIPYKDAKGREYRYGEFFPIELSPLAYNESVAQEFFPLSKEEAVSQGYSWRDPDDQGYDVAMQTSQIPNTIEETGSDILNQVIGCEHAGTCNEKCTTAFKITSMELQFYQRMRIPIPTLCPNCRHYARLGRRTPFQVWRRKCMCGGKASDGGMYSNTSAHSHNEEHCANEFDTSYAPERDEVVYCEECYNAEIV
tara:strand:- start:2307 stop:3878 length:1572 start_codon:yes stop_codon:yes gene_type:complete